MAGPISLLREPSPLEVTQVASVGQLIWSPLIGKNLILWLGVTINSRLNL